MATVLLSGLLRVSAQDALLTPQETQILATPSAATGQSIGPAPTGESAPLAEPNGLSANNNDQPRRFKYSLSLTVRGIYDDNVYISSVDRIGDYYVAIEPAITLGFGNDSSEGASGINFTYRPSIFLFDEQTQRDTVQHLIRLTASHQFSRLSLSLSQDVQILDGTDLNSLSDPTGHQANTDVGQVSRQQIYTTGLGWSYDLTSKTFLSGGGSYLDDNYSSGQISSQTVSGNVYLNYNYSPKLVVGFGGTGGYNTVSQGSPDQTYEQANARLSYVATGKVSLNASGGMEFRQFGSQGRGTYVSPVYQLGLSYQPFDGTSIAVTGSRSTQNSAALAGQDYADTNINLTINQRFLERVTLGFSVGYDNSNYFSTAQGVSATRNDDYYYIQPSFDINITRYWTAGAYYQHRQDSSSFAFFSFYDNQAGIRSTLTF